MGSENGISHSRVGEFTQLSALTASGSPGGWQPAPPHFALCSVSSGVSVGEHLRNSKRSFVRAPSSVNMMVSIHGTFTYDLEL